MGAPFLREGWAARREARVPMRAIRRAVEAAKVVYDVERPLILLRFMHDGRDLFVRELKVSPMWDSLRTDPRFRKFLKRVNLD